MKSVLITGADRGVGYCLTEVFLREGWKVYAGTVPDLLALAGRAEK